MKPVYISLIAVAFLFGCVPASHLEKQKDLVASLTNERDNCQEKLNQYVEQNDNLLDEVSQLQKQVKNLQDDTLMKSEKYTRLKKLNNDLNELYDRTIEANKNLVAANAQENQKLSLELEHQKMELDQREVQLEKLKQELSKDRKQIESLRQNLEEREKRVNELEDLMSKKDEAVRQLKDKITNALLNFSDAELQIEQKDGKIYVSMSEQLLFKSGRTDVDPKGQEALHNIASVLSKNPEIDILVEGHTDNVPMNPNGAIKNNWQLSVLRATSIVQIMINNQVNPKQVLASGRGEHYPVATNETPEGRAKNRRTEIILTPKLDELFKILEGK